jgi:hypothetical protein
MSKTIAKTIPPGAAPVSCLPAVTSAPYAVTGRCEFDLPWTAPAYFARAHGQLAPDFHVIQEENSRIVLGHYEDGEERTIELVAEPLDGSRIAVQAIYTVYPD